MSSVPATSYLPRIQAAERDPQQLEQLYQAARAGREADQFTADLLESYRASPENLLYAAWFYRLQRAGQDAPTARQRADWRLAVPLSVVLALVFWLVSDPRWLLAGRIPYLAVLWAPLTALFLIGFLTLSARGPYLPAILASLALVGATAYVLLMAARGGARTEQTYLTLMLLHLPLLAWAAVGVAVLGWGSSARNRFAFLTKSLEVMGTAGVAVIAGAIFVGLTYGMFQALSVELPMLVIRLLVAGGAGLIPVLAVASVYSPALSPSEQDFTRGLARLLNVLLRALLPLTLLVLVVYLAVIPFNFFQPFVNRDVLVVYNVVLFAIMGLLIGVVPLGGNDLSARAQTLLRAGVLAVGGLVLLVSLYALSAVAYRTAQGQLTMNRLAVIGWNVVNIGILAVLLFRQLRAGREGWVESLQSALRLGTAGYVVWGAFLTLALPWLF
jgi:hypothetical protein